MKLLELTEEKTYRAEIKFFSRTNSRRGQWSTKRMGEALAKYGHEMEPVIDPARGKALIQKVTFSGTRDEIIKQRKEITSIVKTVSQGAAPVKFRLLN